MQMVPSSQDIDYGQVLAGTTYLLSARWLTLRSAYDEISLVMIRIKLR